MYSNYFGIPNVKYFFGIEKYGSSPIDWVLSPMDMYKSQTNTPRVRCNVCRQFGHTSHYCKEQYKPEICIMCGMEGHNIHSCNKKLCFSVSIFFLKKQVFLAKLHFTCPLTNFKFIF